MEGIAPLPVMEADLGSTLESLATSLKIQGLYRFPRTHLNFKEPYLRQFG
jgi:hypothetical protein